MIGLVVRVTNQTAKVVLYDIVNEEISLKKIKQTVEIPVSAIDVCTENERHLILNYKYKHEELLPPNDDSANETKFVDNVNNKTVCHTFFVFCSFYACA